MTLGDRIKELREQKGWKQSDLANKVGVSQPTVAGWEAGTHQVRPQHREKLCEVFGVTPNELYGINPASYIKPDTRQIPVFDVSCGKFIDWTDRSYPAGHYPETEVSGSKDPNAFYVRAHGDSMTGRADDRRTVFDGDLLLVEPGKQINDGDLVFCRHDGKGVTVKKFKRDGNRVRLIPLNDSYREILLEHGEPCRCFRISEIKRKT